MKRVAPPISKPSTSATSSTPASAKKPAAPGNLADFALAPGEKVIAVRVRDRQDPSNPTASSTQPSTVTSTGQKMIAAMRTADPNKLPETP
jgi:hypothetical protein